MRTLTALLILATASHGLAQSVLPAGARFVMSHFASDERLFSAKRLPR